MELSDVKTVKEELIEDMVKIIEEDCLLEGYDFSDKLRGVKSIVFLSDILSIKEKEENPFPLIQSKLDEIIPAPHCYIKYEISLIGTDKTIWEKSQCDIIDINQKTKEIIIEELDFDEITKTHKLSYYETDRLSCHITVGSHPLFGVLKSSDIMIQDPVSEMKFRPRGERYFFKFNGYNQHLVSQNHLIRIGQSVRVKKDGKEHTFKYDGYIIDTQKLMFSEGDLAHSFCLKYFDDYQILEVF